MDVDELCLWDIEKMVNHCRGYFKVSKLWYLKPMKVLQRANGNGNRRPIISNERSKQTPVMGPATAHPTAPGVI